MKIALKKLNDQVIVRTGVSSGIGLETAREAEAAGAVHVIDSQDCETTIAKYFGVGHHG